MRMNISVPDAMAEQVRRRNMPISAICQRALREELAQLQAVESATDIQVYSGPAYPDPDPATWPNYDPALPHLVYGRHPVHGEGWTLDHAGSDVRGFFPGGSGDAGAVLGRAREWLRRRRDGQMEVITVEIGEPSVTVRFTGRWLVKPDPHETGYEGGDYWGVALTRRGRIAVFTAHCNDAWPPRLQDYDSLDAARAPGDLLALAAAELGETRVLWLDI